MQDKSIKRKIIFIEDRSQYEDLIRDAFGRPGDGDSIEFFSSPASAADMLNREQVDALFFRKSLCGLEQISSLRAANKNGITIPLIMIREREDRKTAAEAFRAGVSDVVSDDARSITAYPVVAECALARARANVVDLHRLNGCLQNAHRLSCIGLLVADVAHEINNPLTGTIAYSELLEMKVTDESIKQDVEKIVRSAVRCKKIIDNLLTFTGRHASSRIFESINDIIERVIDLRGYSLRSKGIRVERDYDSNSMVVADSREMHELILNILMNAQDGIEASPGTQGVITVTTRRIQENGLVRISIADNGQGIQPDLISRIFEPFSTSKPAAIGLGLSICRDIVSGNGGLIRAENRPEGGAVFIVELPSGAGKAGLGN